MKNVAIIFDGNIVTPKGKVNSILNRIKHLQAIADYNIDVYTIQEYDSTLMRLMLRSQEKKKDEFTELDGVRIKIIWRKRYFIDWVLFQKMNLNPILSLSDVNNIADNLRGYDLICSHSYYCGLVAKSAHDKLGIPYVTNWHGFEIHTQPYRNKYQKKLTIKILQSAEDNFFVSRSLADYALAFAGNIKYGILYNGINTSFRKYNEEQRISLRNQFDVSDTKVVAFVGNLVSIKNPMLLPEIFNNVKNTFNGKVVFWLIGDGNLRPNVEKSIASYGMIDMCYFWGNLPFDKMPDIMNCIDVLVLPSVNESFGMVLIEAIACGANAVGARVGGIPEVIGIENTFNHGVRFVNEIAERILTMLSSNVEQKVKDVFYWEATAKSENEQIRKILQSYGN